MSTSATETAAPAPHEAAPGWMERWGDRLNPLVVKEVRQGVRSRIFWVCFGLMLLACFVISLVAFVSTRDNVLSAQGAGYFVAFFVCLGTVHFFIIPYSAYRSLAREREDETWVLLVLTGLGPRRILWGKVSSYLVQAGLYASAAGPFLLFSYYLNGIDLPTILVVLALGGLWLVFLTVVAVCAATLADERLGRALVHFLLLGGLGMSALYGMVSAGVLSEQGFRFITRDNGFVAFVVAFLWMMLSGAWLLFETAAARLSLLTENYSRGPRLALAVQVVGSALVAVGVILSLTPDPGFAAVLSILGCLHLSLVGVFMVSDHDGQARALRAGTRPWSLLRPGALRGFRLLVLLLLVWGGLCAGLHLLLMNLATSPPTGFSLLGVLAAPLYAILYLALPVVVGRMPRSDRLASPALMRVLYFGLVGLGGALPPLVSLLLDMPADEPLMNLLNPFVGLDHFNSSRRLESAMNGGMLACVGVMAGLMAFAADRVLVERERRAHAS